MRRIVAFDMLSADGYFTSADGRLDWTVQDEEVDRENAGNIGHSDAILFGRKTYGMFESFWPGALSDSGKSPDPHQAGRQSTTMHDMAVFINAATKIVFSRTLKKVTWKNSRIIKEFDPKAVEALKHEDGKDIMIFGSGEIVSKLTEHQLIDEYHFLINPVFLGAGRPLITGVSHRAPLKLDESKSYRSGIVRQRYSLRK
ncbi:MAG: dihydrofolate reductase family protein [Gemmatimonadaceae bacterium]